MCGQYSTVFELENHSSQENSPSYENGYKNQECFTDNDLDFLMFCDDRKHVQEDEQLAFTLLNHGGLAKLSSLIQNFGFQILEVVREIFVGDITTDSINTAYKNVWCDESVHSLWAEVVKLWPQLPPKAEAELQVTLIQKQFIPVVARISTKFLFKKTLKIQQRPQKLQHGTL
jgi:hypothetical protein